jgi:hypothetical protein
VSKRPVGCRFCEAEKAETLGEAIRRLRGCNNCRMDIQIRGKWSGDGLAILRRLAERYGADEVAAAWEKAHKEKP